MWTIQQPTKPPTPENKTKTQRDERFEALQSALHVNMPSAATARVRRARRTLERTHPYHHCVYDKEEGIYAV